MVVALIFTAMQGFAVASETKYAQDLARARSGGEIARLEREFAKLKIAQTACRIQLAEKTAPVSCYEALAREGGDKTARVHKLDRLCARAAAALRVSSPNSYVSSACAKRLREALAIRAYRSEDGAEWSSY